MLPLGEVKLDNQQNRTIDYCIYFRGIMSGLHISNLSVGGNSEITKLDFQVEELVNVYQINIIETKSIPKVML